MIICLSYNTQGLTRQCKKHLLHPALDFSILLFLNILRIYNHICGVEVSMCEYLPHINSSLVDLHTEHVLSQYTILDTKESELHTVCFLLRDWCSFGGIPLAVEIPGS
jgi:hypothetical protein